ncbi:MAG: ABC transporter permease [Deltaproteobacteria bacterium]|jgi:ABC-type lipoprotein release transport system permease subunit
MNTFMYGRIALRNIRRNSRRSALTILAVAFGLFCLIVFQALKEGLHQEMVTSTVRLDAGTLQIHAAGHEPNLAVLLPIPHPERAASALRQEGFTRFSRRLKAPTLLLAGEKSSSVLLAGVEPDSEAKVTMIGNRLTAGTYLTEPDALLLGQELAAELGVKVGGKVTLMAQNAFGRPTTRSFTVGGLYRTDLTSFDRTHIYLPLAAAQTFLDAKGEVTEIAVNSGLARIDQLTARLRELLPGDHYQVRSWAQVAPDVQQLIELNDATMDLLILIVFAIVALGITNTMNTVIFERFRELGILAAIGTEPAGILSMIVLESSFLGLIAAGLGSLAGTLACLYLHRYGIDLTSLTSANQYFATSHVLKAVLTWPDLLEAVGVTLATAVLAGIYPAWKGARLKPVKAILHI